MGSSQKTDKVIITTPPDCILHILSKAFAKRYLILTVKVKSFNGFGRKEYNFFFCNFYFSIKLSIYSKIYTPSNLKNELLHICRCSYKGRRST